MKIVDQPPDYYFASYFNRRYFAHFFHKRRINKVISLIPEKSFVLDAGCGSGVAPFLLASKKGCEGVGIDIRKECLEFASENVPAFKFCQEDIRSFSLPNTFDVVICMDVIEHFDSLSQAKIIDCLDFHLKDGGLLVLTFPSKFYFLIEPLWKLVRRLRHPSIIFDDSEYHHQIPAGRLTNILKGRGYTIEQFGLSAFGLINYLVARKK